MELKIRKSWNYKSITIQIPEDVKIKPLAFDTKYTNPIFLKIVGLYKSNGFVIANNPGYDKNYKCLSKYHKQATHSELGDFIVFFEKTSSQVIIKFGYLRNLYSTDNFWNKTDNRHTKCSYLEELLIKKWFNATIDFFADETISVDAFGDDDLLTPVEKILKKERINTHIHGGSTSLEELSIAVEKRKEQDYFIRHNALDANKKELVCGEVKYFYNYKKRLMCGKVYHNINNMWWVLYGNDYTNEACFELFDLEPGMPKKRVNLSKSIAHIERKLNALSADHKFQECIGLSKTLKKLKHQLVEEIYLLEVNNLDKKLKSVTNLDQK